MIGTTRSCGKAWQAIAYGGGVAVTLSLWHAFVTGGLWPGAAGAFAVVALLSMLYGAVFARFAGTERMKASGLTLQFVSGYFGLNTLLFILSLASPLGVAGNLVVASVIGCSAAWLRRGPAAATVRTANATPEFACLGLCAIAATLWSWDALAFTSFGHGTTIFRIWQDSFFHARLISAFAQSHGAGTIQSIQMADAPPALYHYASYALPATVSSLARSPSLELYAGFMLPFGILLSGLVAFCLAASIWGKWSGLAAAAALLLLPDSYQHGFGNRYLSYHFLQQVNPGGLYGVACAGLAWVFLLDGCRKGRYFSIFLAYVFTALTVAYKAHIFVANAFVVLIYPCLFLAGASRRQRIVAGLLLTALFVAVVGISQTIEGTPALRLRGGSGSAGGGYLLRAVGGYEPGVLKTFFTAALSGQGQPGWATGLWGVSMILSATFGGWLFLCGVVLYLQRRTAPKAVLLFPAFVIVNYVFMALGLAMDDRGIGNPDELVNRPLVWAYFVVTVWTAGGAYAVLFGNRLPKSRAVRMAGAATLALGLAVPFAFSRDLQTMPAWGYPRFSDFNAHPRCLLDAAGYVRDHSRIGDVVQDSDNDPRFVVTALTERQAYAIKSRLGGRASMPLQARFAELEGFSALTDSESIDVFARERNIGWYLLRPESNVTWPKDFLDSSVFECGGFRVFQFQ
jgi:hypothetical protein